VRHMTQDLHEVDENERPREAPITTWDIVKHAVSAWWHRHPIHMACDLARPVLGKYADKQPVRLLLVAGGIGAAAAILRPWRLISLGGVLLATLKSSELSSVLHSLLSTSSHDSKEPSKTL
jgi:hypothetical protein